MIFPSRGKGGRAPGFQLDPSTRFSSAVAWSMTLLMAHPRGRVAWTFDSFVAGHPVRRSGSVAALTQKLVNRLSGSAWNRNFVLGVHSASPVLAAGGVFHEDQWHLPQRNSVCEVLIGLRPVLFPEPGDAADLSSLRERLPGLSRFQDLIHENAPQHIA
jgi:hypothetical protein